MFQHVTEQWSASILTRPATQWALKGISVPDYYWLPMVPASDYIGKLDTAFQRHDLDDIHYGTQLQLSVHTVPALEIL